jgi:hypothetical protein
VRTSIALVLAIAMTGCGSPTPSPAPPRSAVPDSVASPEAAPDAAAAEARLAAVLDPGSRDLLTWVDPEETIEATLDVADPKQVAADATRRGFSAEAFSPESVLVIGRRNDVLVFAAGMPLTKLMIAEDHRPDRWLPAEKLTVAVPLPGFPYLGTGVPVDASRLNMSEKRRAALVVMLGRSVRTIDGQPYARISVQGDCDPGTVPVCILRSSGVTAGAGGRSDELVVVSNDQTAGEPRFDGGIYGSVPRELARAAEWIARHDPVSVAAITGYESCCSFRWEPARPGLIAVGWWRPCAAAVAEPGRPLAETGDCFDSLEIAVDVGRATVVSIGRRSGP